MAKQIKKRGAQRRREKAVGRDNQLPVNALPMGRGNLLRLGVALIVIALGYLTLSRGSITLAPILLVLGYCALVPWAILHRGSPVEERERANSSAG